MGLIYLSQIYVKAKGWDHINEEDIKSTREIYFPDLLKATTFGSKTCPLITHMQIETEEELENDLPDTLDIETAIKSVRMNQAPGTDSIRK